MPGLRFVLLLFAVSSGMLGADYCAARVFLKSSDGNPASALVELRDANGRIIERRFADQGEAEFCDFGFGEHTIEIGGTTCAAIIIPHVRARLGNTLVFRVLLNDCNGADQLLIGGCRIYFRVATEAGDKLSGVSLTSTPAGVNGITDRYGRIGVWINVGQSMTITFTRSGYRPGGHVVNCAKATYMEEQVVMGRVQ